MSRSTPYVWRERDSEFAKRWTLSILSNDEALESTAFELAMDGNTRLLVWLLNRKERRRAAVDARAAAAEAVVGELAITGLGEEGGDFVEVAERGG